MSVSKQLSILSVNILKINDNDLIKLRKSYKKNEYIFSYIPEWTINQMGLLINSNNYLQFLGHIKEENPKEYLVFDLQADGWLHEEISQAGAGETFNNINFKEIFEKVVYTIPEFDKKWRTIYNPLYLIVETTWITSYDDYSGGYECESENEIVGYLNSNLEKVLWT